MQLAKGAEAELTREDGIVVKERIKKGYRVSELDDKLRKRRTTAEAKLLREARRAGVLTPQIIEEGKTTIKMEFIDGEKVKDALNGKNLNAVCREIGRNIALMHGYDIIHGDLTTSNMLINRKGEIVSGKKEKAHQPFPNAPFSIYFIDFGLGFISSRDEDKAVDMYLLHEVLESTHFEVLEKAWPVILKSYKEHYQGSDKVIKALSNVEKRGRYKERGKD